MSEAASAHEPWTRYTPRERWVSLAILILIGTSAAIDRAILPILFQPIKAEFQLTDQLLGLLGGAPFAIAFALSSIPLARVADRHGRKPVLLASLIGWSVMTVLFGLAPTLALMFLARMGVGFAEGGSYPPSHALIAEWFADHQRGIAFALYTSTSAIGFMLASSIGGLLTTHHGWRSVFFVMGAIGIPIAVLVVLFMREVRAKVGGSSQSAQAKPKADVKRDLQALAGKRSYLLIVVAILFYSAYPYGVIVFTPSYMVRIFDMGLTEAGAIFGLSMAVGSLIGSIAGGFLSDRLRVRDERWLMWLPAISILTASIAAIGAYSANSVPTFVVLNAVALIFITGTLPATFAAVQHVCGRDRRATASAVVILTLHAVGMTLAPVYVGTISDLFASSMGAASLRYGMLAACPLLLVAMASFWAAAGSVRADRED